MNILITYPKLNGFYIRICVLGSNWVRYLSGWGYSSLGFWVLKFIIICFHGVFSLSLTKHALASLPYLTAQTHLFYVYVKTTFADNMHILKVLDLLGLGICYNPIPFKKQNKFYMKGIGKYRHSIAN